MNRNDDSRNDEPRREEAMRGRSGDHLRGRAEVGPPPPSFRRGDGPQRDAPQQPPMTSGPAHPEPSGRPMLFLAEESSRLRSRWSDIQAAFVDEPREAVRQADALVNDVARRVTDVFTAERAALEKQWDRGDQVTTEDLRVALQRYRAFFDHLLSV